ncbi:hypothetical protein ABZX90_22615 [Streptomyces sp. NPDC002935]|uniref:hypothetical protein n=1 Tax=Streptomyces sp. NPDC002935 TaxID=3154545 RepID=UPI0033A5241A
MPPTPPTSGSTRSAAVLNALIRGFWSHPDKRLDAAERAEYAALVTDWAIADAAERRRGDVVKAA